ncbi:MAG: hypothetical protein RL403_1113 [Bacteroidota bacterium]|jgi:hypothetical protein
MNQRESADLGSLKEQTKRKGEKRENFILVNKNYFF